MTDPTQAPRRMPAPDADTPVPGALALAFAPLHKRAFGMAVGTALGLLVAGATVIQHLRGPVEGPGVGLLREYFFGYDVSWIGALAGLAWGFVTGFVAGWFVAFCRNLVIAVSMFIGRTQAELRATRDFLDHI